MSYSALYRFEAIAELYYKRFHRLAPGKSEAPETGLDSSDEANRAQFKEWRNSDTCFMDAIDRICWFEDKIKALEGVIDDLEERLGEHRR